MPEIYGQQTIPERGMVVSHDWKSGNISETVLGRDVILVFGLPDSSNCNNLKCPCRFEGHSPITSLFKCNISYLWHIVQSLCICRVSCMLCTRDVQFCDCQYILGELIRSVRLSTAVGFSIELK